MARADAIQRARRADADEDDVDPGDDEEPGGKLPSGSTPRMGASTSSMRREALTWSPPPPSTGLRDVRLRDVNAVEFVRLFEVKRASNDGDFTFLDQWHQHLENGMPLTTNDGPLNGSTAAGRCCILRRIRTKSPCASRYAEEGGETRRLCTPLARRGAVVSPLDRCIELGRKARRSLRVGRCGGARDTASSSLAKEIDEAMLSIREVAPGFYGPQQRASACSGKPTRTGAGSGTPHGAPGRQKGATSRWWTLTTRPSRWRCYTPVIVSPSTDARRRKHAAADLRV